MNHFFLKLSELIDYLLSTLGIYGPIFACLLIMIESIVPILPLGLFITMNFLVFGHVLGFILSWIFTVIGCVISFYLFRKGFKEWFTKRVRKIKKADAFMQRVDKLKFQHFVILVAIPFTPAFLVNIAAGLSHMKLKNFIVGIAIGKLFMVYFWGFVGLSLVQSLTDPKALINVIVATGIAYLLSLIINKKFELNK